MTTSLEVDVAIAGCGPVGAFGAILLAEAGLRVAVLDRTTEVLPLPRAVGLDGESVRAFQRIGLGDEVESLLQPERNGDAVYFTDSARNRLFGLEFRADGVNGWRDNAFFDQPELEGYLRKLAATHERIDLRLGCEVTSLAHDADSVLVNAQEIETGDGLEVRAPYAIGCDGASSFVRSETGIAWESLGYDQDWLVVDIVMKREAELPEVTLQVCDPARLTTYVCGKDPYRRWEFQLLPGETREEMEHPDKIRELLAPWLPPEHYELRRKAVYQFHAATASRWQSGRIFLAGDAAHQTPPFLGQGLNAGFRDVVNLGWKLPLVLDGTCSPELLASYAAERDAHARDLVEWAVAVGKLMESLAASEAGLDQKGPSEAHRRSGYGQGRGAPPLRSGVLVEAQIGRSSTGALLAQPTVATSGGRQEKLDELLGRGFAVVGRDAAALRASEESAATLARLGAKTVSLSGLTVARGFLDRLFESHPAAIVRPDRHVFGVVDDDWSLDRLVAELARRCALAPA